MIVTKEASPEKGVTMEKIIEMQKKRKEEKPVKMLIKGGMLFKVVMMMIARIRTIMTITKTMMVMIKTQSTMRAMIMTLMVMIALMILFKDGMTTEEKKADTMGLTVKEMITVTEGLTRSEVGKHATKK